jgi:hypothetical protein
MKTLLEHHYAFRLKCLEDDSSKDYLSKLKDIERMAEEMGWRFLASLEGIENRAVNIKEA